MNDSFGMSIIHEPKMQIGNRIILDNSGFRFVPAIIFVNCEPERETNCRFSIRNNQTTVDKNGYNGIPFHFSGPKGRRFKSCHLDQSLSGNVLSWQAFFYALHKNSGLFRTSPIFLRNGLRRILSDIVGFWRTFQSRTDDRCNRQKSAEIHGRQQSETAVFRHGQKE